MGLRMAPRLSICVTTYNRAAILDDCLERLRPVAEQAGQIELLVSDNGSTDDTWAVIERHAALNPAIAAHRFAENRGMWANRTNALFQARGELVVFLADDDSLILDNLAPYVERMEREPDIVGTYADWLAWDDQAEAEMHRYFNLAEPVEFAPGDPLGLVNFMIQRMIPPEVAVYRRKALVRALSGFSNTLPFHVWMYVLSRQGRVRFDLPPFYKEHRVLKAQFARTHWANMELQLQYIGDEMRLTLESMLMMAVHDAGLDRIPDDNVVSARNAIDRMLNARVDLEINRALNRRNWILAVELRRRQVLWNGPGPRERIQKDAEQLVMPAALQSINQTCNSLSSSSALDLRGFSSRQVHDAFAQRFPDTRILAPGEAGEALIVHRDERTLAGDRQAQAAHNVLVLQHILTQFRLARDSFDLRQL